MELSVLIDTVIFVGIFLTCILYVLFGQVTVRRLRKNPELKNCLGLEFASGWDIFNVALIISYPRWITEKIKNTKLSFMYADKDAIYKNTTKFDRFIGRIFYFVWSFTVIFMLVIIVLNKIKILKFVQ